MGNPQSVPECVEAAQMNAKPFEDRISEILQIAAEQDLSKDQQTDLIAATKALELAAIDIFSLFESRMQRHFKRGPFARKLKALLLEEKQTNLANRFHQYYLAVNVLKHGTGASLRELLAVRKPIVIVKPEQDAQGDATGLVDVSAPGFFSELTATILEAYQFLDAR